MLDTDSCRLEIENVISNVARCGVNVIPMVGKTRESDVSNVNEWEIWLKLQKFQALCWGVLEGKQSVVGILFMMEKMEG